MVPVASVEKRIAKNYVQVGEPLKRAHVMEQQSDRGGAA
jgi:hypothetical protein